MGNFVIIKVVLKGMKELFISHMGDVGRVYMVVCWDVVPKATPNDRVRAEGPKEKPSAGDRMKRA